MAHSNLIDEVLSKSESKHWQDAKLEWSVWDVEEDEECGGTCVCGQEGLRYLFTIRNDVNDNEVYPIGSHCINLFERSDMDEYVSIMLQEQRLLDRVIKLGKSRTMDISNPDDKRYFSRKLIEHMREQGAFGEKRDVMETVFGEYMYLYSEEPRDYQLFIDMFNQRRDMTRNQHYACMKVMRDDVYPYLRDVYRRTRTGVSHA